MAGGWGSEEVPLNNQPSIYHLMPQSGEDHEQRGDDQEFEGGDKELREPAIQPVDASNPLIRATAI
jgi:hypothetical protein